MPNHLWSFSREDSKQSIPNFPLFGNPYIKILLFRDQCCRFPCQMPCKLFKILCRSRKVWIKQGFLENSELDLYHSGYTSWKHASHSCCMICPRHMIYSCWKHTSEALSMMGMHLIHVTWSVRVTCMSSLDVVKDGCLSHAWSAGLSAVNICQDY